MTTTGPQRPGEGRFKFGSEAARVSIA